LSDQPLSLDEVAVRSKLNRNTVFKILSTLSAWEVVRSERHKGYSLGFGLVRYFEALKSPFPLINIAEKYLEQLRDSTEETTGLYIEQNNQRICIHVKESHQVVRRILPIGNTGPLYFGAIGKVLLAYKTVKQRDEIMGERKEISYVSGETITKEEFYKRLDQIKQQGYAVGVKEGISDVWAVAAPIFGSGGEVIAGIAASGPINRAEPDHIEFCAKETKKICDLITLKIRESFKKTEGK
jgi:DNA-binding IclR family transcriptional regulator